MADLLQQTVDYFERCARVYRENVPLFVSAGATEAQVEAWAERCDNEADYLKRCVRITD